MNNNTHDRYAQQPSSKWVGHIWVSTRKDENGFYLRGQVLEVAPGKMRVRWLYLGRRAEEWVGLDGGTFQRSAVRNFLNSEPGEEGRLA